MIDKSKLTAAFKDLRKLGYFARQNFLCCQSCGWSAIPNEKNEKVCFYHAQDADHMKEGGDLYLAWAGDGNEIQDVLEKHGLATEWAGTNNDRIMVIAPD